MIRHSNNTSESWSKLPWKKFRRNLFRLQVRLYKAVKAGDMRKTRSLQKLILKSKAARLLAIRQVTRYSIKKQRMTDTLVRNYWTKRSQQYLTPKINLSTSKEKNHLLTEILPTGVSAIANSTTAKPFYCPETAKPCMWTLWIKDAQ